MGEHEASLFTRLRAAVAQPDRTRGTSIQVARGPEPTVQVRDSVRLLSRQRVSQSLRQLRAACGLTYEQVQERTGLPQQLLYDVEYRERRLVLDELRVLVDCYGSSVNDILGIDLDL